MYLGAGKPHSLLLVNTEYYFEQEYGVTHLSYEPYLTWLQGPDGEHTHKLPTPPNQTQNNQPKETSNQNKKFQE